MDYKKLDEIVAKLEKRHIVGSANGLAESKDILALTMYYQIQRANEAKTSDKSARTCSTCYYLPKKYDKYCDTCNGTNKYKQF